MAERYIWISRWETFQHYKPERDRAPAWIKTYTKQLDDERYLDLTWPQRAILHDLRSAFSRTFGRLPSAPRAVSQRVGGRVTSAQLKVLSDAGFIEFVSREVLDQRLEQLYSYARGPRARIEVEVEKEREETASKEKDHSLEAAAPAIAEDAPNPFTLTSSGSAQQLVGEFVDACRETGIEAPRRTIGQVAQETGKLVDEGIEPDAIRAGYRRMVQRGLVQPSLLANFVAEASIPNGVRARASGQGLTPAQILEMTRENP
jgi:hypothetical protein